MVTNAGDVADDRAQTPGGPCMGTPVLGKVWWRGEDAIDAVWAIVTGGLLVCWTLVNTVDAVGSTLGHLLYESTGKLLVAASLSSPNSAKGDGVAGTVDNLLLLRTIADNSWSSNSMKVFLTTTFVDIGVVKEGAMNAGVVLALTVTPVFTASRAPVGSDAGGAVAAATGGAAPNIEAVGLAPQNRVAPMEEFGH